ncbi:hypothetical protein GW17_00004041, partial [Ensete ventricosum]
MVMVHVKTAAAESSEEQQFLYECRSALSIDEMTDAILGTHALQSHIQSLALLIRQRLLADPSLAESYPDVALALKRSVSEAETYVSKVAHKKFLSPHALRAHIKSLEKEVKVVQSKGFLDFDLPQLLSDCDHIEAISLERLSFSSQHSRLQI